MGWDFNAGFPDAKLVLFLQCHASSGCAQHNQVMGERALHGGGQASLTNLLRDTEERQAWLFWQFLLTKPNGAYVSEQGLILKSKLNKDKGLPFH